MGPVFDPFHPRYFDEADLRSEMTRVHGVCAGCRACVDRCDSFPRLFEMLDRTGDGAGSLGPTQQDAVVDGCFDCGLCVIDCPDAPGRSDLAIDVWRLHARARQLRRLTDPPAPASRALGGIRRAVSSITAPRARTRFSTWMARRASMATGSVVEVPVTPGAAVFPTCHVEHHDPSIGRAMVGVIERNGPRCSVPEGLVCCGAPQLAEGDVESFVELGRRNVRVLADAIRAGEEVVVPLPRCAAILQREYPAHVGGSDAELVADHTRDIFTYLLDQDASGSFDLAGHVVDPPGDRGVTMHVPCAVRTLGARMPAAQVLRIVGFDVEVVEGCASSDRRAPERIRLTTSAATSARAREDLVGECPSALGVLTEHSGVPARHPVHLLATAYRLDEA